MRIEIDTLIKTLRERETKERELNYELCEKEKRIRELTSSNKEYVSKNGQLLEDCDWLSEERDLLAINLDNAKAKLRILVEERNNLKAINENLQTELDALWNGYQTLEQGYNYLQDGNRSEDEDAMFTFDPKDNPHPGPKEHRRCYSAPPGALLSPAQ